MPLLVIPALLRRRDGGEGMRSTGVDESTTDLEGWQSPRFPLSRE